MNFPGPFICACRKEHRDFEALMVHLRDCKVPERPKSEYSVRKEVTLSGREIEVLVRN